MCFEHTIILFGRQIAILGFQVKMWIFDCRRVFYPLMEVELDNKNKT